MASASQVEAFAWWLNQEVTGRTWRHVADRFGIPTGRAQEWVAAFNRELKEKAKKAVSINLETHLKTYEEIQGNTLEAKKHLSEYYLKQAEKIREKPGQFELSEVGEIARGIKTVYSVVEAASGADIAKKRAVNANGAGSNPDGSRSLPDLGDRFDAYDVEAASERLETDSPNDSANEISREAAETPENKGSEKSEK